MNSYRIIVLMGLFFSSGYVSSYGQSQEKIYSLFLMTFAKGIDWPDAMSGNFTIDILSYPPLQMELNLVSGNARIKGRKVEVRLINDISEAKGHLLFIPAFKAKLLPKALERNLLVVSNSPGVAKNGGALNFVLSNGKLVYEINVRCIESHGLKVSSALRNSGVIVESVN